MRIAAAVVLIASACSDPTVPGGDAGPDAETTDAAIDAVPVDADRDAIDGPPPVCPVSDPAGTVAGTPPAGRWNGGWTCVADCTRPVAAPLFAATSVTAGATLTWATPGGTIQHAAVPVRGCWVVAASECATGYALCTSTIGAGVLVQFASVFQLDVGRWQVWEFRGHVP